MYNKQPRAKEKYKRADITKTGINTTARISEQQRGFLVGYMYIYRWKNEQLDVGIYGEPYQSQEVTGNMHSHKRGMITIILLTLIWTS